MLRVACMSRIIAGMDTVSSLSTFRPAIGDSAIATPSPRQVTDPAPRRCRTKKLTSVNRSTRLGKRIDELKALYESAFPAGELSPMRRERIGEAAQKTAMAEHARGKYFRGEGNDRLEAVMTAERLAERAIRAIGIAETRARKPSPLAEHFSRPPGAAA